MRRAASVIIPLALIAFSVSACVGGAREEVSTPSTPTVFEDDVQPVQQPADTGENDAIAGDEAVVDGDDGDDGVGGAPSGTPAIGEARIKPISGNDLKFETFGSVSRATYTRKGSSSTAYVAAEDFSGTVEEAVALVNADGATLAEKTKLSGCNALRLEKFSPEGDKVNISVFCVQNKKLYTVAVEGPWSSYDDLKKQFNAVLDGFSFAGTNATAS